MNIQHSSRNDDWMTPHWVIDLVKNVLGEIELDPASSEKANDYIKAKKIYTIDDDALSLDKWCNVPSTIYINPPGGKLGNKSKTGLFWQKLMQHREQGLINHAIFMCFSIEALQSTQLLTDCLSIGEFPICIPKRRIAFVDPTTNNRNQPSHSNCIVYVPGIVNNYSLFREMFSELGTIMRPCF